MARSIRVIARGKLHEIVTRARRGLPLPPNRLTNTILAGIISRTQRHDEVTLCNYVYMNNHSHKHVIPKDPAFFPRFYGEISKKITDSLRTLLGRRTLRIWEDRATVMVMAELEDCIKRLIYVFTNPTKAGLVDKIEDYPGLNSWNAFITCPPSVEAEVSQETRWFPVALLPRLRSTTLSENEAKKICEEMSASEDSVSHKLVVKPFAWLAQFGITASEEIEAIRQKVIRGVRELEAEYRTQRAKDKKQVLGEERVKTVPYLKPHTPKLRERKIFLICSNKELRIRFLSYFESIFAKCKESYQKVRRGITAVWPPGTFTPWLPPTCCHELRLEHF
jgi:hypothetical protein